MPNLPPLFRFGIGGNPRGAPDGWFLLNDVLLLQLICIHLYFTTDNDESNSQIIQKSLTDSTLNNEYKEKFELALKENDKLKLKLHDNDKQLKQILRDLRVLNNFEKSDNWFEKYNELYETMKDQEKEVSV